MAWATLPLLASLAAAQEDRTVFRVKHVAQGVVYLDGGSAHGLAAGMRLDLRRLEPGEAKMAVREVGTAVVLSVATQSALCEVDTKQLEPAVGDEARLSEADATARQMGQLAGQRRRYAQVIQFTNGDPLEEEVREYVPRPPLQEEGRFRGRFGFEYFSLTDHTSGGLSSFQTGGVARVDWTRIGGSYWTLTGYWRGRINARQTGRPETLTDLTNRTYLLGLFYSNPRSKNQMGFGRLLLPWASSLSTLDGGYYARRMTKHLTTGVFAGSATDPAQWNFDPNRQMAGVFTSAEAGNFDRIRWTGTVGVAVTRVRWRPERQFLFLENNLFFGQKFSAFYSMEADQRNWLWTDATKRAQLSRSFLTLRVQPNRRISFDLNHNYFRGLPTFDVRLIGLGLVDRLLFTGLSGGVRFEPIDRLVLSATLGQSAREGDTRRSINQFYGASWMRLPWIGGRLDGRYSRYVSAFGSGAYETVGYLRDLTDMLRLELQVGQQESSSPLSRGTRARFVNSQIDWMIGQHYFVSGGWLLYRGLTQNYDQIFVTLGYRFQ